MVSFLLLVGLIQLQLLRCSLGAKSDWAKLGSVGRGRTTSAVLLIVK